MPLGPIRSTNPQTIPTDAVDSVSKSSTPTSLQGIHQKQSTDVSSPKNTFLRALAVRNKSNEQDELISHYEKQGGFKNENIAHRLQYYASKDVNDLLGVSKWKTGLKTRAERMNVRRHVLALMVSGESISNIKAKKAEMIDALKTLRGGKASPAKMESTRVYLHGLNMFTRNVERGDNRVDLPAFTALSRSSAYLDRFQGYDVLDTLQPGFRDAAIKNTAATVRRPPGRLLASARKRPAKKSISGPRSRRPFAVRTNRTKP